jgi:hypothetical protein
VSRKRICVITFKPVRRTVHVLRQIDYLAPHYQLTVIGHGEPDPAWPPLAWHAVTKQDLISQLIKLAWCVPGRVLPACYEAWFWGVERHKLAYQHAVASGADAYHANDWEALPVAVAAARRTGARVVFHMHEYAEEERTGSRVWRLLVGPAIRYFMRRYATDPEVPVAASITVCEPIAERYRRELGLRPIVVYNAPRPVALPPPVDRADGGRIRLVHHGYAKRNRGLHELVRAVALADERFTLDFMLVEDDRGYVDELRALGERLAPGRIAFRAPVEPHEIVRTVAEYAMGLCVIEPTSYNQLMMLPNKLFEYVQAGLALCVGPSPAMTDLVGRYGLGVCAPSFAPADVAATLNRLTEPELRAMQQAARRAAAVLNADVEMAKVVALYGRLFDAGDEAVAGGAERQPAGVTR